LKSWEHTWGHEGRKGDVRIFKDIQIPTWNTRKNVERYAWEGWEGKRGACKYKENL